MKTKQAIFLLIVIGLFFSCNPAKRARRVIYETLPPPTSDTVRERIIETKWRDTTIYLMVPADTIKIRDTIYIDAEGYINYPYKRIDVEFAYATLEIKRGVTFFELYQKEQLIEQRIENAVRERLEKNTMVVVEKIPYAVPVKLSGWDIFMLKFGKWAFFILIGAGLVFLLRKKIPFL